MNIIHTMMRSRWKHIVPSPIRTALRRGLSSSGLFDEFSARVGLQRVYADDVFVSSYPKSGNTWVRFLIANMLSKSETVTFRNIERFVPFIDMHRDDIDTMPRPRYIKTHDCLFDEYPRTIYVYRDGRDSMISYYHYATQKGWIDGTFSEFLKSDIPRWNGAWHEHVSAALAFVKRHPVRMLLVRYESMLEEPLANAALIRDFLHLSATDDDVGTAVKRCSFGNLQRVEREFGAEEEQAPVVTFFRTGKKEQWKTEFPQQDLGVFLRTARPTLLKLNYDVS